jgi:hypothetical protein
MCQYGRVDRKIGGQGANSRIYVVYQEEGGQMDGVKLEKKNDVFAHPSQTIKFEWHGQSENS